MSGRCRYMVYVRSMVETMVLWEIIGMASIVSTSNIVHTYVHITYSTTRREYVHICSTMPDMFMHVRYGMYVCRRRVDDILLVRLYTPDTILEALYVGMYACMYVASG